MSDRTLSDALARRRRLAEMIARTLLNDRTWRGRLDPRGSGNLKEFASMFAKTTETIVDALMERDL